MAFASSRVLRIVSKYSQEVNSPYSIDGKKMTYDPERYGYQYSTKLVKQGFESGARFLNRIPRYREVHPELVDTIKFQRFNFFFVIAAIVFVRSRFEQVTNEEVEDLEFQRTKDKKFVDRYAYKQLDVEFVPKIERGFNF